MAHVVGDLRSGGMRRIRSLEGTLGLENRKVVVLGRGLSMSEADSARWPQRVAQHGWKTAVVPSVHTTESGLSADALIAYPTHIGVNYVGSDMLSTWDASPLSSPGGLAAA